MPRRARDEGVNQTELAKLHGVSRQTIIQWTVAGLPQRDDGSYMVAESIAWRIARAVEKAKRRDGDEGPKLSEMNRKLAAEADLKEMQLARERSETLKAEDFHTAVSRIAGGFAAVAKGRLSRFEREALKLKTPADARRMMDRISVALLEGANEVAQELDDEADAEDAAAREKADQ